MGLDYTETAAIGYFYELTPEVLKKLEKNLGQTGYDEDDLRTYELGVAQNELAAARIIEKAGLNGIIKFIALTDQMGNGYDEHVGFVLKDGYKRWTPKYDDGILLKFPLAFDMDELVKVTDFLRDVLELEPVPLTMLVANIVY